LTAALGRLFFSPRDSSAEDRHRQPTGLSRHRRGTAGRAVQASHRLPGQHPGAGSGGPERACALPVEPVAEWGGAALRLRRELGWTCSAAAAERGRASALPGPAPAGDAL